MTIYKRAERCTYSENGHKRLVPVTNSATFTTPEADDEDLVVLLLETCAWDRCNNCDTSIEYIQQHYFHYDAKRATGALATGMKGLRAAASNE